MYYFNRYAQCTFIFYLNDLFIFYNIILYNIILIKKNYM